VFLIPLLTGKQSKKLRKEAMEMKVKNREATEKIAAEKAAAELAKSQVMHDMAIAIRIMFSVESSNTLSTDLSKEELHAITSIYWKEMYVMKFSNITFPKSWHGFGKERFKNLKKEEQRFKNLKKEELLEYAVIILKNQQHLDDTDEFRNDNINKLCTSMAMRKAQRERIQASKHISHMKKQEKEQKTSKEVEGAYSLTVIRDMSSRGRKRSRVDCSNH
jgi:hypothetical protein